MILLGPIKSLLVLANCRQGLPSTFHGSGQSANYQSTGSVTYQLELLLESSVQDKHQSFRSEATLIEGTKTSLLFHSTRPIEAPDPKMIVMSQEFSRQSLHLLPGKAHQHLTPREVFHSVNKSKLPKEVFTLHMFMPSVAVVGQGLPLVLNVKHDTDVEQSSGLSAPPVIFLQGIKVEIVSNTGVIAPCSDDGWSERTELATESYSEYSMPITDNMDLGNMLKLKIPKDMAPTFQTSNIQQTHKLAVEASVGCAGEEFQAAFETNDLLLWSSIYAPGSGKPSAMASGSS